MRRVVVMCSIVAALGLLAGACGDDDDGDDASSTSTTAGPSDTSEDTTTAAAGSEAVVIGTGETEYGEVLTDTDGLTLYVFADDGDGGVATCVDSCADTWPPVIAENVGFRF